MSIISNSIHNNSGGNSTGVTSRTRTYRSGSSTLTLHEGQTLKGVVSDIHGNEITLSMDDGSSFTGKLPDANQYSIGQKAAFQITGLDDNTIYMKATTGAYLLDMEDTIEQALEEAGLPKSTRNLDVVRSLLQNQQSISRQNIMNSIQLCARFPKADVNSVITMKRLGMPMNESSVKQFENYQNQTHQLLYKMDSLSDSVGDMLQSIGTQVPRLAKDVGTQLLTIALESNLTPEEQQLMEQQMATADAGGAEETMTAIADGDEVMPDGDELLTAEQQLAGQTLAEEQVASESSGPLSRMRQLFSAITDGNAAARNAMMEAGMAADFRTPFIHEQIGFLLSPEDRAAFAENIAELPLSEEIRQSVLDGTITTRDFLTAVQNAFPQMSDEQAGGLLASKAFSAIIKGQFLSNWTVSPEHLKEEGSLDEVYEKMSRQLEVLSHFSEKTLGTDLFKSVSQQATDMTENLEFMKTLNDTFQYIQLPLKLQEQNAHGDLYIMTRKEALKKDPKNLKVLLHLTLDNLGTLDIHITKENSAVSTKFYVSSDEALHLLEKNIELLDNAIQEQGYAFQAELAMTEKEVDVVEDFVSAEAPVGDIKRYNFDLRA